MDSHGDIREGWRVSQVEQLIELPRRDIKRACYQGQGGVGILQPEDSAWGRRTYGQEDLAKLFIVRQYKSRGYSLPEIKGIFEQGGGDYRMLLDLQIARLQDQLIEIEGRLLRAQALRIAVENEPFYSGKRPSRDADTPSKPHGPSLINEIPPLIERQAIRYALRAGASAADIAALQGNWLGSWLRHLAIHAENRSATEEKPGSAYAAIQKEAADVDGPQNVDLPALLVSLLQEPGIGLAIELWLGPGSYEPLYELAEAAMASPHDARPSVQPSAKTRVARKRGSPSERHSPTD